PLPRETHPAARLPHTASRRKVCPHPLHPALRLVHRPPRTSSHLASFSAISFAAARPRTSNQYRDSQSSPCTYRRPSPPTPSTLEPSYLLRAFGRSGICRNRSSRITAFPAEAQLSL